MKVEIVIMDIEVKGKVEVEVKAEVVIKVKDVV